VQSVVPHERDPASTRRPGGLPPGDEPPLARPVGAQDEDLPGALEDQARSVGRPVRSELVHGAGPGQAAAMAAVGVDDEEIRRPAPDGSDVREPPSIRRPGGLDYS
jgi:hypothetical protein